MRGLRALCAVLVAGALAAAGPAAAEITVAVARITEGALWVIGQVDQPEAEVTLDDAFRRPTGAAISASASSTIPIAAS